MLWKSLCKVKAELIVPVLIVSYATFYYFEVSSLSGRDINLLLIAPVYYLIVLSAVLYVFFTVRSAHRQSSQQKGLPENQPEHRQAQPQSVRPVASVDSLIHANAVEPPLLTGKFLIFAISTLVYVLLFDRLGFVTSSILYLAILMYLLGMKSLKVVILVPAVVVAALYLSMVVFMRFPLPTGWLI